MRIACLSGAPILICRLRILEGEPGEVRPHVQLQRRGALLVVVGIAGAGPHLAGAAVVYMARGRAQWHTVIAARNERSAALSSELSRWVAAIVLLAPLGLVV